MDSNSRSSLRGLRPQRAAIGVPLLLAVVVAGLVLVVQLAGAASAAPAKQAKYYPPLLNSFSGQGGIMTADPTHFYIGLDYGGGGYSDYPQISKKADAIPYLKIYLTLPVGASVVQSKVTLQPSKYSKQHKYWGPRSPSLNPKQTNPTTWLWRFRGLQNVPIATWTFKVDWGTATSQCLKAVAHPMYFKRVKTNGRWHKVLRPIPHAPVQTAYNDPYSSCS